MDERWAKICRLESELQEQRSRADEAEMKNKHLREQVRYWSYCTWDGMTRWCPEKREELRRFLGDELGISPYDYKPQAKAEG